MTDADNDTDARVSHLPLEAQISLLSGAGFWRTKKSDEAGMASVLLADGPHGLRTQPDGEDHLGVGGSVPATCFPPAVTVASTWNDDLAAEVGRAVGTEATALGVGMVLGPGLNIKRHPLCGRNFEYFSEDPLLSGRMAAALVEGLQSTGVGACVKHFAVNNQEGHRFVVDAVVDERTIREIYLPGFEHVITRSRPRAVMAAYNKVNGVPAAAHRHLLQDILRGEWQFDGLVMSDWGGVGDRVAALAAGLDLEMPGSEGLFDAEVIGAIRDGRLERATIETSARRVARLAAASPAPIRTDIPVEVHDALVARVAAEGTVLLANDGILPLRPGVRVALIGAFAQAPRYQGSGSSAVNPTRITTMHQALTERGTDFTHAAGYDPETAEPDQVLIDEAVEAAGSADVCVVMVGLPGIYESEGFDRPDMALPTQHDALVAAVAAANPRTVVALSNGSPVLMPWKDQVAAVVESYLGGQASGTALAAVLYGDAEPSGRLAETFPVRQADVAADPWFPGTPRQVEYREGLFVGYRHHVTAQVEPLFPFGHGLSYTQFEWTDPELSGSDLTPGDQVSFAVTVTNTGDRPGADVVQVYLRDLTGVVLRPERELAGYAKVHLGVGESRRVRVTLPARAFAFWDVTSGQWQVPEGAYDVLVARSSVDVAHQMTVKVRGGVSAATEPADSPALADDDALFEQRLARPLPVARPIRPFTRDSTIEEVSSTAVGRAFAAIVLRASPVADLDTMTPVTRRMFERSIAELPLRSAAIFARGRLPLPALDAVVAIANRDPRALALALVATASPVRKYVRHRAGRPVRRPVDGPE